MALTARARLTIQQDEGDLPGAFGRGCVQLLQGVAREHSLSRAAKELGMAYSKAWRIVREAEAQLGCELLLRDGARGSTLTPEGERALAAFLELQGELDELVARRLPQLFADLAHPAREVGAKR